MAGPSERVTWAPTDVLRAVVAAVVLAATVVLGALFHGGVTEFLADLLRGLDRLPEWFVTALVLLAELLALVLIGGGLVVALVRREWRYLATIVVAVAVALLLFVVLQPVADGGRPSVTDLNTSLTPVEPNDVPGGVALVTAIVTAAAPWVSRRWRRWAWAMVVAVTVVWFIGSPIEFDVVIVPDQPHFVFSEGFTAAPGANPTWPREASRIPNAKLSRTQSKARRKNP